MNFGVIQEPTPAMISAATRAMEAALDLRPDDRVLVVGDEVTAACAAAFVEASRRYGCTVSTFDLPPHSRPLDEVPADLAALIPGPTVVINAIPGHTAETPFRIEWLNLVESQGTIRMGHAPGISEDMMTGGSLDVDYRRMHLREEIMLDALRDADSVRLQTALGTDLTVSVAGRQFISDLKAVPDCCVNLPCGEIYCAPVEGTASGVLVADGPVGDEGVPPMPVRMEIVDGRAVSIECDDMLWRERIERNLDHDSGARVVCELGMGLNPGARLVGRMLEDEKALRTAHVAFGDNQGFPGGRSQSGRHVDFLVHLPTVSVQRGGETVYVLRDGDLAV